MSKKPKTLPRQIYIQRYVDEKQTYLTVSGSTQEAFEDRSNLEVVSNVGVYRLCKEIELQQELKTRVVKKYKL